jgi:hypothetical protein
MDHDMLSYALWRATKKIPQDERVTEELTACIVGCAYDCFDDIHDPSRYEVSFADNNSRSLSVGSHQSHGSAVKHQPVQAPAQPKEA